ncbi:MAG: DUF853 family protein [Ruminococcus flavefaciens]|nr:DUF853 family protein [Ruminococcus flavefaciens]
MLENKQILTRQNIDDANKQFENLYNKEIESCAKKYFKPDSVVNINAVNYLKIVSVVKKSNENPAMIMREQMQKVLMSMWTIGKRFHMIVRFDGTSVNIYIGAGISKNENLQADVNLNLYLLRSILESSVSGVTFETENQYSDIPKVYRFNDIDINEFCYFGTFGGNPVVRDYNPQATDISPLDDIIMGSTNIPWMLVISGEPVSDDEVTMKRKQLLDSLTKVSECVQADFSIQNSSGSNVSMNTHKKYSGAEIYHTLLQAKGEVYEEAMQCGMWSVAVLCFSSFPVYSNLFGGIYSSQMRSGSEEKNRPFPFKYFDNGKVSFQNREIYQAACKDASTFLTGRELAQLCMLPVRDTCGFNVSECADFDVNRSNNGNMNIGNIVNGQRISTAQYRINLKTLNRHGLIIGLTGGGKTNTVKSLLHSISELNCPFMVIEPAKKEYFELYRMGMTDIQVYSVGSTGGNILKINPFEVVKTEDGSSVSLQSHIDTVFASFKASFIMYTPMPYVLENAIYAIYDDYGWDVETGLNRYRKSEYPTIEDLYLKIEPVVKDMGYDEKMQNDLIGSLKARINSLRVGAKGRTLNVASSIPMEKLLNGKVVIELDDVGDEDAKAFIISLLLMQIQECRKVQDTVQLDLRHILLIEEAHRLLKNVSSGSGENADPRGNAVEYFCNMLAELRSKGQGFLVIDQIPSKLAPDLIKNTNLKIIHRTVAKEDRELVGGAMNMNDEQQNFLSCLKQGFAAVYSEGDNRPKLVKLPYAGVYEDNENLKKLNRSQIINLSGRNCIKQTDDEHYTNQMLCNGICRHCRKCSDWKNPEKAVRRRLSGETGSLAVNSVCSKNLEEALIWIRNELPELSGQTGRERQETEKCLMALWLNYYQKHMDYSQLARLTALLLDIVKSYDNF